MYHEKLKPEKIPYSVPVTQVVVIMTEQMICGTNEAIIPSEETEWVMGRKELL